MIKVLVKHKKPEVLVITPLLTGHKISVETKKSLKRNKVPFEWISYMGKENPCKNAQLAFDIYRKNNDNIPPYIIKIDNDIIAQRGMIDQMYNTLEKSMTHEAYCYCSFEFQGSVNIKFPAIPFDAEKLKKNNYISSCSLMKTKRFIEVGMWVTDNRGFRLLDWATWLRFLKRSYIGIPNTKTSFIAIADKDSISAGNNDDFYLKRKWVLENFG